MTLDVLLAEGESIAKPAFLLVEEPTDSGIVAYWTGVRTDLPNETPVWATALAGQRHICTVSERMLSALDIKFSRPTGPVSLFDVRLAKGSHQLQARGDGRLRFDDLFFEGAVPLYSTPFNSFPPFPALCCHGSERVGDWLAKEGYARHEYWNFSSGVTEDYEQEWLRRSPLHQPDGRAAIIVGGWHTLWPEDDFYMPPECRLLFTTLRDAEPWYEVWHGAASGGFIAKERIT